MPSDDYNIIKPVENLQNVTGLKPVQHNQDGKRKPDDRRRQGRDEDDVPQEDQMPEQNPDVQSSTPDDDHSIDYCA